MKEYPSVVNNSILEALKDAKILEKRGYRYLVIGSLIISAVEGKIHRPIGDVDILCDRKDEDRIRKLYEGIGYRAKYMRFKWKLGFYYLDLFHEDDKKRCISIIFGDYDQEGGFKIPLNLGFSCYLPPLSTKPTEYKIKDIKFIGFPTETAYFALKYLPGVIGDYPKREGDLEILNKYVDHELVERIGEEKIGFWLKGLYLPNWTMVKLASSVNKYLRKIK